MSLVLPSVQAGEGNRVLIRARFKSLVLDFFFIPVEKMNGKSIYLFDLHNFTIDRE